MPVDVNIHSLGAVCLKEGQWNKACVLYSLMLLCGNTWLRKAYWNICHSQPWRVISTSIYNLNVLSNARTETRASVKCKSSEWAGRGPCPFFHQSQSTSRNGRHLNASAGHIVFTHTHTSSIRSRCPGQLTDFLLRRMSTTDVIKVVLRNLRHAL